MFITSDHAGQADEAHVERRQQHQRAERNLGHRDRGRGAAGYSIFSNAMKTDAERVRDVGEEEREHAKSAIAWTSAGVSGRRRGWKK